MREASGLAQRETACMQFEAPCLLLICVCESSWRSGGAKGGSLNARRVG